ncbi:MAG: hypothetical protein ACREAA_07140 [Candidatus Polarisedimenticolia bacterium]
MAPSKEKDGASNVKVTLYLAEDIARALRVEGATSGRSHGEIVGAALAAYLSKRVRQYAREAGRD